MLNVLDIVLLLLVVLFAISGYRQGFLVGALSFVGFLGGGVLGAKVAKPFAELIGQESHGAMVGLLAVLGLALVGQVAGTAIGVASRDRVTWRPGRAVDAAAGAVLSGLSVLLVAWLLATAVDRSPF
ncbi:CvpA family protein, partial [Frankia casuarinae]